ncbi:hypothetical protein [Roseospira visakhapatnamensis]|uniref:Uncharacterized protein n=1 Tax=Roseospira visakhapatnamensis TaxID=390880 RepID=A0A7W6RCR2_9PROT|nr:hypothetical protein [Roseospira visakhapatnamensis]MBB4266126.1 hypothetical protein [Roseospira visakhapatnamensis]
MADSTQPVIDRTRIRRRQRGVNQKPKKMRFEIEHVAWETEGIALLNERHAPWHGDAGADGRPAMSPARSTRMKMSSG